MKRGENASQSPPERRGFLPSFQKSDMEGQMTMRTLLNRRRERGFTLVEIMIVVLIIGILLAIAVPSFMNARERSRANACRSNLRQIQAAKEQWAMATNQGRDATPDWNNLVPNFLQQQPRCPSNGTYTIGNMATNPTCSIGNNGTDNDTSDDHAL